MKLESTLKKIATRFFVFSLILYYLLGVVIFLEPSYYSTFKIESPVWLVCYALTFIAFYTSVYLSKGDKEVLILFSVYCGIFLIFDFLVVFTEINLPVWLQLLLFLIIYPIWSGLFIFDVNFNISSVHWLDFDITIIICILVAFLLFLAVWLAGKFDLVNHFKKKNKDEFIEK